MTLWGSQTQGALSGFTGDTTLPGAVAVPGMNPARLASNALIDVQGQAAHPLLGGGQRHIDKPVGPYVVTLTPITTAQGAPLALQPPGLTLWLNAVARVVFGRAGTKCEAWIDWPTGGGRFTVACDTLSVNAMAINQATGPVGGDWNVRMGAWATPLVAGIGPPQLPRYTMFLGTLAMAGGTSGEIFVPPFARRWRYISDTNIVDAGADFRLNVLYRRVGLTFANDVLVRSTVAGDLSIVNSTVAVDVPSEAMTMVVNNADPTTDQINARLVFELDLG